MSRIQHSIAMIRQLIGQVSARFAALGLLALLAVGCTQLSEIIFPTPSVPSEWKTLLEEVRAFERRIGFKDTGNFHDVFEERGGYTMCGHAPWRQLPYSYQDPAIQWISIATESECRRIAGDNDVFFSEFEAVGEIGTSVTSMMLEGKLDRFLYLVIHEDCHDQFDLPYGVEEALCELITHRGMVAFSSEKYGARAREDRAVRRYTDAQSRLTRETINVYRRAEQLYARFGRGEITPQELIRERTRLFRGAERALEWKRGELNNVGLASNMTYSRHYPLMERVHGAMGGDLARTVEFFKRADREKPARAAVLRRLKLKDEKSIAFVRAYEVAVVETVERLLRQAAPAPVK